MNSFTTIAGGLEKNKVTVTSFYDSQIENWRSIIGPVTWSSTVYIHAPRQLNTYLRAPEVSIGKAGKEPAGFSMKSIGWTLDQCTAAISSYTKEHKGFGNISGNSGDTHISDRAVWIYRREGLTAVAQHNNNIPPVLPTTQGRAAENNAVHLSSGQRTRLTYEGCHW